MATKTKNTNNLGYATPIQPGYRGRGTDENLIEEVIKARAAGMTYKQLAKHFRVSCRFVSQTLNRSF